MGVEAYCMVVRRTALPQQSRPSWPGHACESAVCTAASQTQAAAARPGTVAPSHLSSCDLAQAGSPTMATLMSPRRLMPCRESSPFQVR